MKLKLELTKIEREQQREALEQQRETAAIRKEEQEREIAILHLEVSLPATNMDAGHNISLLMSGENPTPMSRELDILQKDLDTLFLIVFGILIFILQTGFAFLEAGSVRSKNTTNILLKNMLDVFIGGIAYWLVGFPLAFGGGNSFSGTAYWASYGLSDEHLAFWFFQFVIATTASTIISGSMAERCAFNAYLIYTTVLSAVVYPVVSHWTWSDVGWLKTQHYQDFGGSGVVHLTGGVAALVGAVILGPRIGRFGPKGKEIRGHSVPLAALGGFILLFGFLAFNGGSQASISHEGDAVAIAKAVFNTVISASSGGIAVLLVYRSVLCGRESTWSFLMALNGSLAGMVSISAGCNVVRPWSACVIGTVGGSVFLAIHTLLPKLKVDDPLDAVAVHMGGGLWGLVAVALFQDGGIVYGGSAEVLAWNIVGALAIVAWSGGLCLLMFGSLRLLGLLRVPPEMEIAGMDILKHGEPAYPADAWLESQYDGSVNTQENKRNSNLPPNMSAPEEFGLTNSQDPAPVPGHLVYWSRAGPVPSHLSPVVSLNNHEANHLNSNNSVSEAGFTVRLGDHDLRVLVEPRDQRVQDAHCYTNEAFDETTKL
ncbi:putative ammonium transporter 1 [Procambarus clarkii]|uniref:putative ammonium transporter 1 n=1 Tax=Procambarus clarkii TaxID=6728 RepID=UPI003742DB22